MNSHLKKKYLTETNEPKLQIHGLVKSLANFFNIKETQWRTDPF